MGKKIAASKGPECSHECIFLARVSAVESMPISKQLQFAEKLHPTCPWPDAPNSRVKDLVDMSRLRNPNSLWTYILGKIDL